MCLERGDVAAATVADHVIPHRGDKKLFFNSGLQSLCASCHSRLKQQEETIGYMTDVGLDGWPIDPNHPSNKKYQAT